jgi:prepilin-type N-terminal cleavage/methylation domain-containing protein
MTRRNSQSGMTLIEVTIAVLLFSILSVGILLALRVGINSMERANDRLMANRRAAYAVRILESQLNGFVPQVADFRLTPQSPMMSVPFFQGEMTNMRFVSTYSLQDASRGFPQILEFTVIPGVDGRGVRLIVNELPYTGPVSTGSVCLGYDVDPVTRTRFAIFRPIVPSPASFVLADKLAYCRFFYEAPRLGIKPAFWTNHWASESNYPLGIRVEMAPLDPDPARLQPMTVTTAVHVNKMVGVEYADN